MADTCADAIDVTAGASLSGTTVGATDDYSTGIGNQNCPVGSLTDADVAYVVRPSVDTGYRVVVTPTDGSFDPMLYVKVDCDADPCVDGTVLNGAGVQESLAFTATGGVSTYIIVDGENFTSGAFTIAVTLL
ncbi:MAG: hypothetical protein EP330_15540 [Deltaproteobacteria bacterium]|nr:MAG: hypothetical protein EP330_15540 [Deltaproteobacteria bacterium]